MKPVFRTRRIMECPRCGGDMNQIDKLSELGYVNHEWDEKETLRQYDFYICKPCKIYVAVNQSLFGKLGRLAGSAYDKLKELDRLEE